MIRKFIVRVRSYRCIADVEVWAPNRHKAKAQVARELVERHSASDFIEACNTLIVGCHLARPDPIREAVYEALRWERDGALGAQGAE